MQSSTDCLVVVAIVNPIKESIENQSFQFIRSIAGAINIMTSTQCFHPTPLPLLPTYQGTESFDRRFGSPVNNP
jgi:hypothetical protein